ncbi:hypothetical protein F5Y08DRAFT_342522 [Xylaria arbuscula]|nr:hypothetical protein F5Y08DRAFT_342522 [Xylaria arbuscula]
MPTTRRIDKKRAALAAIEQQIDDLKEHEEILDEASWATYRIRLLILDGFNSPRLISQIDRLQDKIREIQDSVDALANEYSTVQNKILDLKAEYEDKPKESDLPDLYEEVVQAAAKEKLLEEAFGGKVRRRRMLKRLEISAAHLRLQIPEPENTEIKRTAVGTEDYPSPPPCHQAHQRNTVPDSLQPAQEGESSRKRQNESPIEPQNPPRQTKRVAANECTCAASYPMGDDEIEQDTSGPVTQNDLNGPEESGYQTGELESDDDTENFHEPRSNTPQRFVLVQYADRWSPVLEPVPRGSTPDGDHWNNC